MNFKLISLTSCVAFVLSFFVALFSGAGFLIALLRAVILAVIFGSLSIGIDFVDKKFLGGVSSSDSSGSNTDGSETVHAPIGNKVDITIDDEDLQEEENTPQFLLTGNNQMLNKGDLENEPYRPPVEEPLPTIETANKDSSRSASSHSSSAAVGSKNAVDDVPSGSSSSQGNAQASNAESAPVFKPVALGTSSESSGSDEFPDIEKTLGKNSILNIENDENVDVLPEMVSSKSPLSDDTVTDSEFASGGKKTSRLNETVFSDGSKAESKDSTLMAEAIRTILKSEE